MSNGCAMGSIGVAASIADKIRENRLGHVVRGENSGSCGKGCTETGLDAIGCDTRTQTVDSEQGVTGIESREKKKKIRFHV